MDGRLHWLGGFVACMAAGLVVACSGASFSEASGGDAAPDGTVDSGAADSQAPPPDATDAADGAPADARTDGPRDDADATADAGDADATGNMGDADAGGDGAGDGAAMDATLADSASLDTGAGLDALDGSFILGGTVTGLAANDTVVLEANGIIVQVNGSASGPVSFSFPALPSGTAYSVTVASQPMPTPELCTVTMPPNQPSAISVFCDTVTQVATGTASTCALLSQGSVACWGDNGHGELGNGTTINSSTPVAVSNLSGVSAITMGAFHACALVSGAVYCWGYGSDGQLGIGSAVPNAQTVPLGVVGSMTVKAIAGGGNHTCALLVAGNVACWGDNANGDVGDTSLVSGTQANSPVPVSSAISVSGPDGGSAPLVNAVAIAAGSGHTCAVLGTGSIVCWGLNGNGQLGNGTTTSSTRPVAVAAVATGATAVSAGNEHTCAIVAGKLECWGANGNGELGVAASTIDETPVMLGVDATAVACGDAFTCAILPGGSVDCWGFGLFGTLGNGGAGLVVVQSTPTPVSNLTGATALAVGNQHGCALSPAGLECWGSDGFGQLADGFPSQYGSPAPVPGVAGATAIAGGLGQHACAITSDGGVECWGLNSNGQLGTGAVSGSSSTPVPVANLAGPATKVVVGSAHTCALLAGGSVQCWGYGLDGQPGNGTTPTSQLTPVTVAGIANAVDLAAGSEFSCAVLQGGTVECWGENSDGALGNGTNVTSSVPVPVVGLTSATKVACGSAHACALLAGGAVACWGDDDDGQLGRSVDGGTASFDPVMVPGLSGVTYLAAGSQETCAVLGDGGLDCWGDNASGQLGIGSQTNTMQPAPVIGLAAGVVQVTASLSQTCALLAGDGGVECWGANAYGQLGAGPPYDHFTPLAVPLVGATAVAAGYASTCALLTDGGLSCWGSNSYGQLGNGEVVQVNVPGPIQ
jgi:alpha-tubulin suppressor-like RCC1 family protein